MQLTFSKMHGLGNDFMVIETLSRPVEIRPEQVRAWADRNRGIGFDQLLVVGPPTHPDIDFSYQIYNSDGSQVAQCGNGARCFAAFVRKHKLSPKQQLTVETKAGVLSLNWVADQVEVDMGTPSLEPKQIPLNQQLLEAGSEPYNHRLKLDQTTIEFTALSLGNPHGVILVDSAHNAPVGVLGARLETHPCFPERANIGFVEVVDRTLLKLRVFERGAGETQACGSGACAAMVACRLQDKIDAQARVVLTGGQLELHWNGLGEPVTMRGPAEHIYEGTLEIEL